MVRLINKHRIHIIAAALSVVVALSVFYMLILPAVTQSIGDEPALICELTEHEHTAECYELTCVLTGEDSVELSPAVLHIHTEDCYGEGGELTCGLTVGEEVVAAVYGPHIHTEDCYALTCLLPEHVHNEDCYAPPLVGPLATDSPFVGIMPLGAPLDNGYGADLDNFLDTVLITGSGVVVWDSRQTSNPVGTITAGELYDLSMDFSESFNKRQFEYEDMGGGKWRLYYDFPTGLTVTDYPDVEIKSEDIDGIDIDGILDGTVIGKAEITGNKLYVYFYNVTMDGTAFESIIDSTQPDGGAAKNLIDSFYNLRFHIDAEVKATSTGSVTIGFGEDSVTITIVPESPPAEKVIKVEKDATKFPGREIEFTVKVTATSGNLEIIKIDDYLSAPYLYPTADPLHPFPEYGGTGSAYTFTATPVVKKYESSTDSSPETITWDWGTGTGKWGQTLGSGIVSAASGTNKSGGTPTGGDGVFQIVLNPATSLTAGERIEVTYRVEIKADAFPSGWESITGNVMNYAFVTEQTLTGDASYSLPLSATRLSKGGYLNTGGDIVTWTINIGDGSTDLRGAVITDTLNSDMKYLSGSISIYDVHNGSSSNTPIGTITPYVNNADWTLTWTQSPTDSFTLAVPNSVGEVTRLSIVVRTTPATNVLDDTKNTVTVTYPDSGGTGTVTAPPGMSSTLGISKTGAIKFDNTGGYIEYKVRVKLPKMLYGKKAYIYDKLLVYDVFGSAGEIAVADLPTDATYKIYDLTGNYGGTAESYDLSSLDEVVTGYDTSDPPVATHVDTGGWLIKRFSSNLNDGWYLVFQDVSKPEDSLWKVDVDSLLEITYKVPLSAKLAGGDTTILDELQSKWWEKGNSEHIVNTAKIVSAAGEGEDSHRVDWSTKKMRIRNDPPFGYRFEYKIPFGSEISAAPQFTDVFDYRLELIRKDSTFPVKITATYRFAPGKTFSIAFTVPDDAIKSVNNAGSSGKNSFTIDFSAIPDSTVFTEYSDNALYDAIGLASADYTLEKLWKKIQELYPAGAAAHWYAQSQNENDGVPHANYNIEYNLGFKDGVPDGKVTLRNEGTVTLKYANGGEITLNDWCSTSYGSDPVTKDMTMYAGTNKAKATIEINPKGVKFITVGDAVVFDATDTMSSNLTLYADSLKVSAWSGSAWVPQTLSPEAAGDVTDAYDYCYNPSENTIKFCLPDSTPLKIEYDVKITAPAGKTDEVWNTIEVAGAYNAGWTGELTVGSASGGASAMQGSLKLFKYSSDDAGALSGAVFKVYSTVAADSGQQSVTLDGSPGKAWYLLGTTNATGANGIAAFTHGQFVPASVNYLFALVETTAPTGFLLLTEPIYFTYGTEYSVLGAEGVANIQYVTDRVEVANTPFGVKLPETGGRGLQYLVPLGGALTLIGAGALTARRVRRRKGKEVRMQN